MSETTTQKKNLSLRARLFEIQKSIKTMCAEEPSEKKNSKGESEYKYTPGWAVVEKLREQMDAHGVMLDKEFVNPTSTLVQNGNVIENLVTITGKFTWVDVQSGETLGPLEFNMQSSNGIDKSMPTAISNCERYFLLKFFGITTREKDTETDAHYVDNTIRQNSVPAAQPAAGQYAQMPEPGAQAAPAQLFPTQSVPQYKTPAQGQMLSPQQMYESAVNALSYFPEGTQSHSETLRRWQENLASVGYPAYDPAFTQSLVATASTKRNSR